MTATPPRWILFTVLTQHHKHQYPPPHVAGHPRKLWLSCHSQDVHLNSLKIALNLSHLKIPRTENGAFNPATDVCYLSLHSQYTVGQTIYGN